MKLRQATLLAVIGSGLVLIQGFYFVLINFEVVNYSKELGKLMEIFYASGLGLIFVFFVTLFLNQKEK